MKKKKTYWKPKYSINSRIAKALMEIEAVKTIIENTPLSLAVEAEMIHKARVRSTHYSTRIEGNRLTLKEAEQVIEKKKTHFHGRQRDVSEVQNYWAALLKVEDWAAKKTDLTENLIKRLHAIVEKGKRAKPSPYRTEQNVIRDSGSGGIVYMPPEAKDVPKLMKEIIRWAHKAQKENIPIPIIASLVHYQFVTIHPYYDGNGRTARLLATFMLQQGGYGLHGYFSMEEHHARDLEGYYNNLAAHSHHNYYEGRAEVDLTPWIEYFVLLLSKVFDKVKEETLQYAGKVVKLEPDKLRRLDPRARRILALFVKKNRIIAQDVVKILNLSNRMVRVLMKKWVKDGWLVVADTSNRSRSYKLSATYRKYIKNLSAIKKK